MKRNNALKLAYERPPEKVFGSAKFIGLTRKVGLKSPTKFIPTTKQPGDIVL